MGGTMFFFNKPIVADCGHLTSRKGAKMILGKIEKFKLEKGNEPPEYCLDCIEKFSIRCAKCGGLICPGYPVTWYEPDKIGCEYSRYTTIFDGKVIGCISNGCSEAALIIGYWVAPGKVRFLQEVDESDRFVGLE
jgi:hypothetical protein